MVRRMFGWRKAALAALLAMAACSRVGPPRDDPAASVQAFLDAVRTGDAAGFESVVDRPALRADLRRQLVAMGRSESLDLDGGPPDAVLDRMIDPAAFRLVGPGGAPLAASPSKAQAAALIKPTGKDRVCLHDLTPAAACLLSFAREPDAKAPAGKPRPAAWRLVRMPAQDLTIAVGPEPAPAK